MKLLNKQVQKYSLLLLAGLVGIIIADYSYPLLDENVPLAAGLCLFFSPIILQIALIVCRRLSSNIDRLRRAYIYSSGVLILLAAFLALNGVADRAPARRVQTSIARKYISSGRYTTSYHLVVSSWRPGEAYERLRVDGETYHAMFVGEPVAVEVHRGLFALPWYRRISPA